MENNIFKSIVDGLMYLLLYFVVPIAQCIAYVIVNPELFLYSATLLVASLLYDSYNRYNSDESPRKMRKVLAIGIISGTIFAVSFFFLILGYNGVEVGIASRLTLLSLVIPFCISLNDLCGWIVHLFPKKEG